MPELRGVHGGAGGGGGGARFGVPCTRHQLVSCVLCAATSGSGGARASLGVDVYAAELQELTRRVPARFGASQKDDGAVLHPPPLQKDAKRASPAAVPTAVLESA